MSVGERLRHLGAGVHLFRRLGPGERRLLLLAWWDLFVCRLEVRRRRAFRPSDLEPVGPGAREGAAAVGSLVGLFLQAVETSVHGTYCLPRSLALRRFLRRQGTDARLRLGLKNTDGSPAGHAWIEWRGQVVGDSQDLVKQFVPFHETA